MPGLRAEHRHAGNTSTDGGSVDWRSSAACLDYDPELFFPVGRDPALAEPAKELCRICPVVRTCLREAITTAVEGVWGGTTLAERDELRAQYGITAAPIITRQLPELDRAEQVAVLDRGGVFRGRDRRPDQHHSAHRPADAHLEQELSA